MSTIYQNLTNAAPPSHSQDPLTLNIGGRFFTTTRHTLQESSYLAHLIRPHLTTRIPPDGTYFIDADPCIFDHILQYLRRGAFPIFYDKSRGHDYCMYQAILQDAKFYKIPRLVEWLEEERYLDAVKTTYNVEMFDDVVDTAKLARGDEELEWHVDFVEDEEYEVERRPRGVVITKRTRFDADCCAQGA